MRRLPYPLPGSTGAEVPKCDTQIPNRRLDSCIGWPAGKRCVPIPHGGTSYRSRGALAPAGMLEPSRRHLDTWPAVHRSSDEE